MPSLNEIIKSYNKASGQKSKTPTSSKHVLEEKKKPVDPFGSFVKCMAQVITSEQTKVQEQEKARIISEQKDAQSTKKHLNTFFSTLTETLKEEVVKKQIEEKSIESRQNVPSIITEEKKVQNTTDHLNAFFSTLTKTLKEEAAKKQPENEDPEEEPEQTDTEENTNLPSAVEDNQESTEEPKETSEQSQETSEELTAQTNPYIGELSKLSKTVPLSKEAEEENKLKGLVSKQLTEEVNKIRELFPNFGMSGSGGGTNAVQYANGGTMNGDLNVTGRYLSGGVDLADIFSSTGGGPGGPTDRLTSGSKTAILGTSGTLTVESVNASVALLSGGTNLLDIFLEKDVVDGGFYT